MPAHLHGAAGEPPRLAAHLDDLFALSGAAAEHLGVDPAFVEKDFWVTELLRSLARPLAPDRADHRDVVVVFKGGTSLSKVFRLVERFSEDVDILVAAEGMGRGRRDRVLKNLTGRVTRDLGLGDDDYRVTESTTGVKRNVRYRYRRRFPSAAVTDGVLLEMGIRGGAEPVARHTVRSLVAEHGVDVLGEPAGRWAELAPVTIAVLGAERTLVEKLALLHQRAVHLDDHPGALVGAGRHYYDVCRLLADDDVRRRLSSYPGSTAALADDVDAQSRRAGFPSAPRPPGGFAESPAFTPGAAAEAAGRAAYELAVPLIWGTVPTFDQCVSAVHRAADLL
ncbi:MAG: nucleotidyl transferase AbiEii/AbiGii toxin family protein [Acidimicrobiales bacterium]